MRIRVGTIEELQSAGRLLVKAGSHGVCVFWADDRAYALDDRCPHMGFPLHRGTVEQGLVTCHWHHARFDLASGGTLDPFADDVRPFPIEVVDGEVFLVVEAGDGQTDHLRSRLAEGLEQGLTLVTAKSVLGLLEAGVPATEMVRVGVEFGTANRRPGWGAGLTVLVAMANLLPWLDPADRPLALVHGLAFVSRDTRNHPPRFPLAPLGPAGPPQERLAGWYRRFIETRSADAAERVLATALARATDDGVDEDGGGRRCADRSAEPSSLHTGEAPTAGGVAAMMLAAATDHVFLDGGHTLDFTNKAFEALAHLGWGAAIQVLPTLVDGTAGASRAEEGGRWRHPHDLAGLVERTNERLPGLLAAGASRLGTFDDPKAVGDLAWRILGDDPDDVVEALCDAIVSGATAEQLGRAVAFAAALRITRFHTQNDFGDWDVVHHGFTAANALHQALRRHPTPELVRGVVHGALKVYLDRFLNVPAARLPGAAGSPGGVPPGAPAGLASPAHPAAPATPADLAGLERCWDEQGRVDEAGAIAYRFLKAGGDPRRLVAALGHALLAEDAGFHWYQTVEAAVAHVQTWPAGSEEGALVLAGTARFLAAHTPTRRELAHVVRTAARLRRGEDLFDDAG